MLPTASVVSFEETTDAFGPHIVYNIAVCCGDSVATVQRRYTEFVTLHDQLKSANHIIAEYPFPRRRLTSGLLSKSKIANERREAFNTYLQFILEVNPRLTYISEFLNIATEDGDEDDDDCSPLHQTLDGLSLQAALERSTMKDNHILDSVAETPPSKKILLGSHGTVNLIVLLSLIVFPFVWFRITYPGNISNFPKRGWSVIEWQYQKPDRERDANLGAVLMPTLEMIGGIRFSLEVLIGVLVVISVSHRITGYLFGMFIRFMLCKVSGSFQIEFEWVALRLGFDRNEVVFHNIKWHNPPMFTETPHFLMIEEVVVRFELLSCLGAVLSHKSYVAHIHSVLIENVEVYIEKLHQNQNQSQNQNQNNYLNKGHGKEVNKNKTECNSALSSGKASINFYCAIGEIEEEVVVREDYTKRVHTYVSSIFSSMHGSIPPTVIKKTENIFTVSNKSSAQTSSKSLSFRSEKCSSSNSVKNDFEAGRFHDISMLNMSDDEAATAIKENISNILKEKEKEKEREKEKEKDKDKDRISSGKAAFAEIFGLTSRMTSSSEMLTSSAMSVPLLPPRSPYSNNSPSEPLQTNKDTGTSSPADNNSDDDDEKNHFFSFWDKDKDKDKNTDKDKDKEYERNDIDQSAPSSTPERLQEFTQETNDTITIKKRNKNKNKSPHFGIKYRFQIDLLTVKDLRVHAQELLYPTHGEINDSKTIKLSNFTLDKKQLSSKIEKPKNSAMNSNMFVNESFSEKKVEKGIVEGSYADEILHRIVTVIQYEIVAKNKLSLASNLFGAAANHTASAVRVAATTAKRGVADSVIAHNPKELFHMATRVINKTVYSQKYQNALSLAILAHSKLKVRVLLGKNFTKNSKPIEHSIVCSCRLLGPPDSDGYSSTKFETYKSHPKRSDSTNMVSWNEMIILNPIVSYSAILHVRVFEYHLLKDIFICEMFLPLHELLILSSNDDNKDNKEGKDKEKDNDKDEKDESNDSNNNKMKEKENTMIGKEVVRKVVKEAAHEAVKEVIEEENELAYPRYEEDKPRNSRFNTKKFENVFGNIIQSAHTAINDQISSLKTSTENTLQISRRVSNNNNSNNENEVKYDDIYEKEKNDGSTYTSNDFIDKSDFHSENILHGSKDKEKEKEKDVVKVVTKTETKEKIEWFKCYGRLADNELNIEKGQVYLGLLLE